MNTITSLQEEIRIVQRDIVRAKEGLKTHMFDAAAVSRFATLIRELHDRLAELERASKMQKTRQK